MRSGQDGALHQTSRLMRLGAHKPRHERDGTEEVLFQDFQLGHQSSNEVLDIKGASAENSQLENEHGVPHSSSSTIFDSILSHRYDYDHSQTRLPDRTFGVFVIISEKEATRRWFTASADHRGRVKTH